MAQTSPTFRRRRLARRLRQMRDQSGMTLEEAARKLDKTRSSLGRIETGQSKADVHLIRSMMDLYDHYDPDLVDLAREAAKPGWWAKYLRSRVEENRGFIGLEDEASVEFEFGLSYLPGLLQTEDYMRVVFSSGLVSWTEEEREAQIVARLHRQRRLTDPVFPIRLVSLIDESAIRRAFCPPEVMRAQLLALVEGARLPNVSVQVIPECAGTHPGLEGAFIILDYPEPDEPSMLYVSYLTGALHVDKAAEVERAKQLFRQLRERALSPEDSMTFLGQVAAELERTRC